MNKICTMMLAFTLLFCATTIAWAEMEKEKGYYTMLVDKKVILQTGIHLGAGDVFYDDENREYRVEKMQGDQAIAKLVGQEKKRTSLKQFNQALALEVASFGGKIAENKIDKPVVIYHTHSDESYEPSEGTYTIAGKGGIFKVGTALAKGYEQAGIPVEQSFTGHEPHDGMAYDRSRRTATQLMQKRPVTSFDVHRDAAERKEYAKQINGKEIAQILFVIGNQNPNYKTNLDYAKQLKETANAKYPGLSKGILVTSGKFNQDLSPNNLLLEFGAHKNTRESAEATASMFAAATAPLLIAKEGGGQPSGITKTSATTRDNVHNRAVGGTAIYWILGLLVLGVAFLLVNEGSWAGIKARVKQFKDKEFTNFLGHIDEEKKKKK